MVDDVSSQKRGDRKAQNGTRWRSTKRTWGQIQDAKDSAKPGIEMLEMLEMGRLARRRVGRTPPETF